MSTSKSRALTSALTSFSLGIPTHAKDGAHKHDQLDPTPPPSTRSTSATTTTSTPKTPPSSTTTFPHELIIPAPVPLGLPPLPTGLPRFPIRHAPNPPPSPPPTPENSTPPGTRWTRAYFDPPGDFYPLESIPPPENQTQWKAQRADEAMEIGPAPTVEQVREARRERKRRREVDLREWEEWDVREVEVEREMVEKERRAAAVDERRLVEERMLAEEAKRRLEEEKARLWEERLRMLLGKYYRQQEQEGKQWAVGEYQAHTCQRAVEGQPYSKPQGGIFDS